MTQEELMEQAKTILIKGEVKMKIYNILIEYTNFEDEDNNYSEIIGSYMDKESAIEKMKDEYQDQLEWMKMKLGTYDTEIYELDYLIEKWGFLYLEQEYGYGETRIILSENELKDIDYLKEAVREELDTILDDINNNEQEDKDNKEYCDSLTEKNKESIVNKVLDCEELRLGIRELVKQELWH